MTSQYFDALRDITNNGLSFHGKVALITGAAPASIATPVFKGLLAGGCTVVCSFRGNKYDWFRQMYQESAGAQARLICVPFNCGSNKDMDSVLEYVYGPLGLDIDFVCLSLHSRKTAEVWQT
jgi:fatty acid synthase subunit alpha